MMNTAQTGSSPRPGLLLAYVGILLSPVAIVALMVGIHIFLFGPVGFSNVAEMVRGGTIILVVHSPQANDGSRQQLTVVSNNEFAAIPRLVRVERLNARGEVQEELTTFQLTETQWIELADLRNAWCRTHILHPPARVTDPDVPFYDVGMRCQQFDGRRFTVPADQVPPQIENLLLLAEISWQRTPGAHSNRRAVLCTPGVSAYGFVFVRCALPPA